MGNEVVVDVRVVRKTMQQHESRPAARKVSDIEAASTMLNPVLGESRKGHALGVRHDLLPLVVG